MENKNLKTSLNGSIIKGLLMLALPILAGNLLQSSYQFVDAYWVGKVGKEAVAAVSVSGPITFLIVALGTGFAMAGTILVAQYAGAGKKELVNHSAAQTLLLVVAISLLLSIIGFFAAEWILQSMGVAPEVMHYALPYLQTTFCGLLFTFIFSMFQSILRGVGEVNIPLYIILSTVLLNFVIDPMFILGFGPIPSMGPQGAAIATLITQGISAGIGLWILFRGKHGIKLNRSDFKPDFGFIKKAFNLGFPSSLEMSVRALGFVLLTSLITSFGTNVLAAYGAGANINQFIFIPLMGLSIATSTMIGQNLGARQLDRAQKIAKTSALISFSALTSLGILVYIFAPQLIQLFIEGNSTNQEVIQIGSTFLRILAFSLGFMGIQFSFTGVFRAAGNTMMTMILGIISMFVLEIPLAYWLSKQTSLGVDGIWRAFPITNIAMAVICYVIYQRGKRKEKNLTQDTAQMKIQEEQEEVYEEAVAELGK
ncbi:MAG: MATE family efflux transporter [candidate division SR1 bacterium]|nr:MATE family efflux transporter [candidate division SR1 bacterium]